MFSQFGSNIFTTFLCYNYKAYPQSKSADRCSKYATILFRLSLLWLALSIISIMYNVFDGENLFSMLRRRRVEQYAGILGMLLGNIFMKKAKKIASQS